MRNYNYYYTTDLTDILDYDCIETMSDDDQNWEISNLKDWFFDSLENYAKKYRTAGFIVAGSSKRWDGKTTGFDVVDLQEGDIDEIFSFGRGCDDIAVYSDNDAPGALYARGVHHDGGVSGEIMTITRKGLDYVHNHCDVRCDRWPFEVLEHLKKTGDIKPFFSGNRKLA